MSKYSSSSLSASKRRQVYQKTGGRCWYCGTPLKLFPRQAWSSPRNLGEDLKHAFTVDHIIPRKQKGTDKLDNLVPACQSCNCSKGGKNIDEYREHVTLWMSGIPKFTDEQREWLTRNGYPDPHATDCSVQFWGEMEGIA